MSDLFCPLLPCLSFRCIHLLVHGHRWMGPLGLSVMKCYEWKMLPHLLESFFTSFEDCQLQSVGWKMLQHLLEFFLLISNNRIKVTMNKELSDPIPSLRYSSCEREALVYFAILLLLFFYFVPCDCFLYYFWLSFVLVFDPVLSESFWGAQYLMLLVEISS